MEKTAQKILAWYKNLVQFNPLFSDIWQIGPTFF
jgi:hypothetical protein